MSSFINTIEEIRPQIKKIVKKWNNKFEEDELINEAWLIGHGSPEQPTKVNAKKRIMWDIQSYIRTTMGRTTKKPLLITNMEDPYFNNNFNTQNDFSEMAKENSILNITVENEKSVKFENEDLLIKLLSKASSKKQIQAISNYYIKGYTLKETGKNMNIDMSTVSGHIKNGIKKCQTHPINKEILKIECLL